MIVEGLAKSGSSEAKSVAEDIVVRWIRTNYVAYKETGAMHEKYDVEKCGDYGGGGEYVPQVEEELIQCFQLFHTNFLFIYKCSFLQTGFGWSNGVVLAFLEEFGWPEDVKIDCP